MFRLFSCMKFFSTTGKALMLVSSLFVLFQAPKLNAQSIVEKAKKEGKLVLYTTLAMTDAVVLVERFQKKYPFIKAELNRLNTRKIISRLLAEHRANKNKADVITSKGDGIFLLQKKGILDKYLSPERKFYGEKFKDKEGYWTDVYPTVHSLVYNTRMVAPNEVPTKYQDLINPKWNGNFAMNLNNYMWSEVVMQILGREEGLKFLETLAQQKPLLREGNTLLIMLVSAGEFAWAVSVNANLIEKHKAMGAPVERAELKPYYGDLHPIALAANAPHPNAAKLFIDYFLSQEGQELMVEFGKIPARIGLKSRLIRSEEIIPLDPALGEKTDYYQKLLRKIFTKRS